MKMFLLKNHKITESEKYIPIHRYSKYSTLALFYNIFGKFSSLLLTGLKNREFDVCPGTVATVDRTEAGAAFTLPFLDTQARFQVILGNPRGFDPSNVEGKTIGMLNCILNISAQSNLTLYQKRLTIYSSWTMIVCFIVFSPLVHGDAFYTNEACLHRIGLKGATVLVANSISEAINTTLNGTVRECKTFVIKYINTI